MYKFNYKLMYKKVFFIRCFDYNFSCNNILFFIRNNNSVITFFIFIYTLKVNYFDLKKNFILKKKKKVLFLYKRNFFLSNFYFILFLVFKDLTFFNYSFYGFFLDLEFRVKHNELEYVRFDIFKFILYIIFFDGEK